MKRHRGEGSVKTREGAEAVSQVKEFVKNGWQPPEGGERHRAS